MVSSTQKPHNAQAKLTLGVTYNNMGLIREAIETGADVHFEWDSAIRTAATRGYLDIVKYLVSCGADFHVHDDMPMRLAALNGNTDIVLFLLSIGSDIYAANNFVMRAAVSKGYLNFIKMFVKNEDDIKRYSGVGDGYDLISIAEKSTCKNAKAVKEYLLFK